MTPTDEQLKARGLTREQYDRRNKLWHAMLRELPPDERERINENTQGMDALIMATRVEMIIAEQEKKGAFDAPRT
jgi:hypothetical protein